MTVLTRNFLVEEVRLSKTCDDIETESAISYWMLLMFCCDGACDFLITYVENSLVGRSKQYVSNVGMLQPLLK